MARDGLGWWVVSGDDLLAMLRRVEAGESADIVYAEEYANCDRETVPPAPPTLPAEDA